MEKKINLWQPIIKSSSNGKTTYDAVLSDDSLDRDDEMIGKEALLKVKRSDAVIVGLMDHENKIMNQVCEWVNKRIEERNGHTAFVAEPKFFKSNPNAKIIKGMLDEGANMGISIGAIVKNSEMRKIGTTEKRVYTDIEVVEASFVGVPANKHARITAIAKMFKTEENKVSDEKTYSEKEFKEQTSKVADLEAEIAKVKEELEKVSSEASTSKEELDKQLLEKDDTIKALELEVEKLKKAPMHKAKTDTGSNFDKSKEKAELEKQKEIEDNIAKGYIPVGRC